MSSSASNVNAAGTPANNTNPFTGRPYSVQHTKVQLEVANYPVAKSRETLLERLKHTNILLVVAETGSGKSTKFVADVLHSDPEVMKSGGPKIMVTLPRQLAAIKVAERLCEIEDVTMSNAIGLRMRGVDKWQVGTTRLEIVTDGMASTMLVRDSLLLGYKYIFIDEVHERSAQIDLLLARLKSVVKERAEQNKPLKVILMSATMDPAPLQKFFPGSVVERVVGRRFPVHVSYLKDSMACELVEGLVDAIFQIHVYGEFGDILVFVAGVQEINAVIRGLDQKTDKLLKAKRIGNLDFYPLHASLGHEDQQAAITAPAPWSFNGNRIGRKVIVATNYAETSVTIDGIVFVVDNLTAKAKIFDPRTEKSSLCTVAISQDQAEQRAGRAGRTREGHVIRMCTEEGYAGLRKFNPPKILYDELLQETLALIAMGHNPLETDFPTPPANGTLLRNLEALFYMDLIDINGERTKLGKTVSRLPYDPETAVMLCASSRNGCSWEVLGIMSMIQALDGHLDSLWLRDGPKSTKTKEARESAQASVRSELGDHWTMLNVWMRWQQACVAGEDLEAFGKQMRLDIKVFQRAEKLFDQAVAILIKDVRDWKVCAMDPKNTHERDAKITRSLCAGLFLKVARMYPRVPTDKGKLPRAAFATLRQVDGALLPEHHALESSPAGTWVVYHSAEDMKAHTELRIVSIIDPTLLVQENSHYFNMIRFRDGWAKTGIVDAIARITGWSADKIRQEDKPTLKAG